MDNFDKIENIYFLGIGGIGMSSLARYFKLTGKRVSGYDKTKTPLTINLVNEGIPVHYNDSINELPAYLHQNDTLVIYTPAIPSDHDEFNWLKEKGYNILKRAKVLGILCSSGNCIAVAGTHGKTTVSTMLTVILKESKLGCGAFLGGISRNYATNFILPETEESWLVTEADEYDRSFLNLHPKMALITSMDSDHLDIYGEHENVQKSFKEFVSQIKPGGKCVLKKGLENNVETLNGIELYTYSLKEKADFYGSSFNLKDGYYSFTLHTPAGEINNVQLNYPGLVNVENSIGAAALSWLAGVSDDEIRSGIAKYKGVNRRFDIRYKSKETIYIDDYAHHPEELNAVIRSVKELFPGKKVTGIFQPHLYTRTRDFVKGFAESLAQLDQAILLPIYPARELPIPGVSSEMIAELMENKGVLMMEKQEVLEWIRANPTEILMTIGAGDIDNIVNDIVEILEVNTHD